MRAQLHLVHTFPNNILPVRVIAKSDGKVNMTIESHPLKQRDDTAGMVL